jgi:hypothetical protein
VIKTLTSVTSGWQYGENTRTTKLVSNLIIFTSKKKYPLNMDRRKVQRLRCPRSLTYLDYKNV